MITYTTNDETNVGLNADDCLGVASGFDAQG